MAPNVGDTTQAASQTGLTTWTQDAVSAGPSGNCQKPLMGLTIHTARKQMLSDPSMEKGIVRYKRADSNTDYKDQTQVSGVRRILSESETPSTRRYYINGGVSD
ncbi:hypothetical protein WN51_02379 [Melipona quadrifasciata]|uniref:Uncharacterized protein n=1 Tax=Melipona quadrifasciata TaxID=166423 RepID=A0A0M8ZXW5_9HYME|nr:hypothetical protein WN51_02379 [Melipona quadrifasciata]